ADSLENDPLAAEPLHVAERLHAAEPVKPSALRAAPAPVAAASSGWAEALEGLERPSEAPTLEKTSEALTLERASEAKVTSNPLTTPEAPIPHIDMPDPMSQRLRPSYDSLVMQLK